MRTLGLRCPAKKKKGPSPPANYCVITATLPKMTPRSDMHRATASFEQRGLNKPREPMTGLHLVSDTGCHWQEPSQWHKTRNPRPLYATCAGSRASANVNCDHRSHTGFARRKQTHRTCSAPNTRIDSKDPCSETVPGSTWHQHLGCNTAQDARATSQKQPAARLLWR